MREMIRGVILALMVLGMLAACLILIAGVGHWQLASQDERIPQQSGPVAAATPVQPGPTTVKTAPAAAELTSDSAGKRLPRTTRADIAEGAGNQTKPPQIALFGPRQPAPAHAQAALLRVDDDSAGGWVGRYGKRGYSVAMAGAPTSLPPGVLMSMAGSHLYIWSAVTTDRRGLSLPADPPRLSAGQWFSWDQFSLDLDLRGSDKPFQVALYLLDWDSNARAQRLEVMDDENGKLLLSRSDEHFTKGRYLLLRLSGHVKLRFTRTAGANCTLSGIFLDESPQDQ